MFANKETRRSSDHPSQRLRRRGRRDGVWRETKLRRGDESSSGFAVAVGRSSRRRGNSLAAGRDRQEAALKQLAEFWTRWVARPHSRPPRTGSPHPSSRAWVALCELAPHRCRVRGHLFGVSSPTSASCVRLEVSRGRGAARSPSSWRSDHGIGSGVNPRLPSTTGLASRPPSRGARRLADLRSRPDERR